MTDQTTFFSDESGAVTVDWVVLTAALVGLGLAVMTVVRGGVQDVSNDIDESLRNDNIILTAFATSATDALAAVGLDVERMRNDARALQNDELATEYVAALDGDGTSVLGATAAAGNLGELGTALSAAQTAAGTDADGNPNPINWGAGVTANVTAADGTIAAQTFNSEAAFTQAVTDNTAEVQRAALLADEGAQRGMTWNGTDAFE
ncbi:MAG: hypothetical protein AAGE03_00130 [Pseudomonadota bacterium]